MERLINVDDYGLDISGNRLEFVNIPLVCSFFNLPNITCSPFCILLYPQEGMNAD